MLRLNKYASFLTALCVLFLFACTAHTGESRSDAFNVPMPLEYAKRFSVAYRADGCARLTVGERAYLLIPPDVQASDEPGMTTLHLPLDHIYAASSSVPDLFLALGQMERLTMTSTAEQDWHIPEIAECVRTDTMMYIGKYSAPDYERLLTMNCRLAIENTMIDHKPAAREQIERLGIPVLTEESSYESDPLGRLEWIRLYGLLCGCPEKADAYFQAQKESVLSQNAPTGKTAVFFHIGTQGAVQLRRPGDYFAGMLRLAGGDYLFTAEELGTQDTAQYTARIDAEIFCQRAVEADILIYDGAISGAVGSMDALIEALPLLSDAKAVRNQQVYYADEQLFQKSAETAQITEELHRLLQSGEAGECFHRLQNSAA